MSCEGDKRSIAEARATRNWFYIRHGVDETPIQVVNQPKSFNTDDDSTPKEAVVEKPKYNYPRVPY